MSKNLFFIFGGIIFILAIGAGSLLYTQAWDPLWNPFRPLPDKVVAEAIEKMQEVKVYHSEWKLIERLKNKEEFSFSFDLQADTDNSDSQNPKSASDFNMVFAIEGMQFSAGAKMITWNKELYLKLTTIPALPLLEPYFSLLGIDLNQWKEQWIMFDESFLEEVLGIAVSPEEKEEQEKEAEKMMEKLSNLLLTRKFYSVKTVLPDEEVTGNLSYHYLIVLEKEETRKLASEMFVVFVDYFKALETEPLFGQDLEQSKKEFEKGFSEVLDKISEISADVWIGKKDKLLYKFELEKEIDLQNIEESAEGKLFFQLEASFSKFNQSLNIEKPENFKSLKEMLTTFELPSFVPSEESY